ncbi:unnamed protein product [Closterium sp. Yama58-4]|nr:unnamed protein product [Closterium sp. Yama58-4]
MQVPQPEFSFWVTSQCVVCNDNVGGDVSHSIMSVANNRLSGTIPFGLSTLTNLNTFDLSNNLLHGTIPTQLTGLVRLTLLYLNGNSLSGSLPNALSAMTGLQAV